MATQARAKPTPLSAPSEEMETGDPNAMANHITIISVVNFIGAGLLVIGGLFTMFAFGVGAAGANEGEKSGAPGWVSEMVAAMGFMVFVVILGLAAVHFLAGFFLMKRKRAGKILGTITAILYVLAIPFGTALSIYSFVILFNQKTEAYWVD